MSTEDVVPIGELARRCGVAASALRYYERLGLLPAATRAGGKRHYRASSAERVAAIRLYQSAGFTLAEIQRLPLAGNVGRREWAELAERKLVELDVRIAEARQARNLIAHGLACPHRDLFSCTNFRDELKAAVERPQSEQPPLHHPEDASAAERAKRSEAG